MDFKKDLQVSCMVPDCEWKSLQGLAEDDAKFISVVHVIVEHPERYMEETGKSLPEISNNTKIALEFWTA